MYDLIVVGGGPAGLTATIYGIRKRLNTLLITKDLGGKTNYHLALPWIEDYQVIRGLEIVSKFRSELEYLDFTRRMEAVEKVAPQGDGFAVSLRGGEELQAKAVIIATGTKQQLLNIPGEREFMMRGLCYSALSYAPMFIDRTVVVVGDGDLALRSSAEMATITKKVFLVCGPHLPTTPLGKKLKNSAKVTVLEGYQMVEVKGDEFAESAVVKAPNGDLSEIKADGIFIEMGLVPNAKMVAGLVATDQQGRIQVDCASRTNVPGIFAAGDVTNTFTEQVLAAVGDGVKAALSAYEYLLPRL